MWCWEFKSGVVCSFSVRILWYAEPPLCSCKTMEMANLVWLKRKFSNSNSSQRRLQRTFKYKVFVTNSPLDVHREGDYICPYQTEFSCCLAHFCIFFCICGKKKRSFHVIKSVLIPAFSDRTLLSWTYTPWCSFTEWVVFFLASDWPLYEMVDL